MMNTKLHKSIIGDPGDGYVIPRYFMIVNASTIMDIRLKNTKDKGFVPQLYVLSHMCAQDFVYFIEI